jgi:NADPH-dependent curcumin reductase CurA
MKSHAISLAERPVGAPTAATFKMIEVTLPDPVEGQVLVKNTLMSVDPYMRGRMNDVKSYVPPFKLGEAMEGGAIGRVVKSNAAALPEGTLVLHMLGFRDYAILDVRQATPIDETLAAPSHYLGVLGVTGLTAYAGLTDVAQLKSGETMFVSAGAGAVGSIAGQLARLMGARAVGSTGSDENVAFMRDTLKFDGAFAARDGKIYEALKAAAPEGIDVYFDNVGGETLEAAIAAMRVNGRIAVCGAIAGYNEPVPGPRNLALIIGKRITMKGFIVMDHAARQKDLVALVAPALRDGRMVAPETFVDGLENAPKALMSLFERGAHRGKLIVRLAP